MCEWILQFTRLDQSLASLLIWAQLLGFPSWYVLTFTFWLVSLATQFGDSTKLWSKPWFPLWTSDLNVIVRLRYPPRLLLVFCVINFSLTGSIDDLLFVKKPSLSRDTSRFVSLTCALLFFTYTVALLSQTYGVSFSSCDQLLWFVSRLYSRPL